MLGDDVDPTDRQQFEAFAIACWQSRATDLYQIVKVWNEYLQECAEVPVNLGQDPASKLIIALLAELTGVGNAAKNSPQAQIRLIRSARN
jgi:hypothetical protein